MVHTISQSRARLFCNMSTDPKHVEKNDKISICRHSLNVYRLKNFELEQSVIYYLIAR